MLFWRTKSAKQSADEKPIETSAVTPQDDLAPADAAEAASVTEDGSFTETADAVAHDEGVPPSKETAGAAADVSEILDAEPAHDAASDSKIVTLVPVKLTERLAEIGSKPAPIEPIAAARASKDVIEPAESATAPGQAKALAALRAAIGDTSAGSHVLVLGPPGTGRRSSAHIIASEIAKSLPLPSDWIYAASGRKPDLLKAYAVPGGTGERFVRDVQDALAKSSAMLARLMASDSHQMTLAVLEEDHRQRSDGPLEQLKRRAEAQNIALVKTADGYVLAPMHEGKVVRADVFRALPEALQRDVEAKVTALESELQALLGALPGNDIATDDRHLALSQQTAERAVKPNLSVARKLFPPDSSVTDVFDAIESDWTRRAADCVRRGGNVIPVAVPGLQAISARVTEGAPVVLARSVSAADLLGEIGRDTAGAIAIRPGHLSLANGGYLIVDAWRLVSDPQAWPALSAALEAGSVQPLPSSGLSVTAEAVPLHVKIIVIAEREAFARLNAIDPRAAQHFGAIVSFESSATAFDVSEAVFGAWAAAMSDALGLRRLSSSAAAPLYEDARSRAGDRSQVSLDIASLMQTLRAADCIAGDASRQAILSDDIKSALLRRAALNTGEDIA